MSDCCGLSGVGGGVGVDVDVGGVGVGGGERVEYLPLAVE